MERLSLNSPLHWMIPIALVALLAVGLWPALEVLGSRWLKFDESYSHGFLVLIVSLVLTVRKWLANRPVPDFYPLWLWPLLAAAAVYLIGSLLLIEALQQIALVPMLIGTLLLVWGWRQTMAFFLPIGVLVFAIPVWDYLSWPLQLVTVAVNQFLLSWLDIEFIVEGVFVYFPGVGAFEIAHGCSGLRYLLVGLTLATIHSELNYRSLTARINLFVAAVMLSLLANWIRVFVIIFVGYESNMTSSLINAHDHFGWWVFAGTLVPLFLFARYLERREARSGEGTARRVPDPASGRGGFPVGRLLMLGVVPLALFSFASWATINGQGTHGLSGSRVQPASLVSRSEWLPLFRNELQGWVPVMERPDQSQVDVYMSRDEPVPDTTGPIEILTGIYTYEVQRPGAELVHYGNRLYDTSQLIPEQTFDVNAGPGLTLGGVTLKYRQSETRVHLAYGYYVEGRWESNELQAKLAQLTGALNARNDASLVVLALTCDSCDAVGELNSLFPDIREEAQAHLDELYGSKSRR